MTMMLAMTATVNATDSHRWVCRIPALQFMGRSLDEGSLSRRGGLPWSMRSAMRGAAVSRARGDIASTESAVGLKMPAELAKLFETYAGGSPERSFYESQEHTIEVSIGFFSRGGDAMRWRRSTSESGSISPPTRRTCSRSPMTTATPTCSA